MEVNQSKRGPVADNLWWLLPPCAALLYPTAVKALYESGKLLHSPSRPVDALAWLAVVVSAGLVYSVAAVGIIIAYLLGRHERPSPSQIMVRRIAHLVVASPSLFVLIGVVFYLLHSTSGESVFWWILWLTALATAAWALRKQGTDATVSFTLGPFPLRVAHGISALLISSSSSPGIC